MRHRRFSVLLMAVLLLVSRSLTGDDFFDPPPLPDPDPWNYPNDPPDPFTDPFDPIDDPFPEITDFPPEFPDDPFEEPLPLPDPPDVPDPFPDFPSLFPDNIFSSEVLGDARPATGAAVPEAHASPATNVFTKLMPFPMRLPFHPRPFGQKATPVHRTCTAATASQLLLAETNGNTLAYLNTCPGAIVARVPVGHQPVGVGIAPGGALALVTNSGDGTVSVVDIAAQKVTKTITLTAPDGSEVEPNAVSFLPDGSRAYVSDHACNNNPESTMFMIDMATLTVAGTFPINCFPGAVAVSPDGAQVWVASRGDSRVDVYDTMTNERIVAFNVPFATGIAFNPTGTRAYLGEGTSPGYVQVIDATNYQQVAHIKVGDLPHILKVTPTGRHLFVTNALSNSLSQIDTTTNTVLRTIQLTGHHPLGLAFIR